MKKIIALLLLFIAFAFGADYKPFEFTNITNDPATQQDQFDYMLQYKLWGTDYIQMGHNIKIPDKSGWNGSRGNIYSDGNGKIVLGGPVLTTGDITLGMDSKFTTGPVRANTFNSDVRGEYAGNICLVDKNASNVTGNFSCDSVPEASTTLQIPTIVWPTEGYQDDIILTDNNQSDTIYVPEGEGQYDVYFKNIHLCKSDNNGGSKEGCKLYIRMKENRLTRIFVDSLVIGNHTTIAVILGDSILPQNKYKGNVLIYSNKDIVFYNTDDTPIQGSFITTAKMRLECNLDFSGQLLANQLEIGNDFKGENFRFVKYDPDTLDFPELKKQGGLKENDSTVIIPLSLSDTATIDVYFTYCFDLKDGVTVDDFNMEPIGPNLPICGESVVTTKIPIGQKSPLDTIKVNVKIDDIVEDNDYLIMRIDSITGAVLPNGETSGELPIKIEDAETKQNTSIVLDKTDTIKTYQEELRIPPGTGIVGNIKYTDDGLAPLVWTYEDPSGLFTVENGVIKTNHVFDYETEDTVYVIKVKVEDGEFTDSANYTIKITNIQEPITVSGKIDSVAENADVGTIVGAIIGKDADSTDVTYSINDVVNFKIDPVLGVITTNAVFDFETKDKYPVTVTVTSTDGSKKDTTFIVNIKDVDEPVHAHDTTLTVKEGDTGVIGTIKGEDEDGEPVKFSCDDTVHYSIDSLTGVLRLVDPFDYETTNSDTLKVVVKDVNGNTDTAIVIINVENVNEPPVLQPNDTLKVPENCDTCFVGIITALDPDKNDTLFYDVKEPGFKIDSAGKLTTTKPFDHETTPTVTITVIVKDSSGAADTATYIITVTDINEPVHVKDTTCSVKENYTGKVCQIPATDEDKTTPKYFLTDTTNYQIDSTGTLVIKNPIDFEKKTKDTVKVVVTDGEFYDTATVVIRVLDEPETVKITEWDKNPPSDTVKTNDPDHEYKWKICEGDSCTTHYDNPQIHKDTTIKVCNANKTVCDSIVVIFNDAPPVVTLTNAKSTDALIDYITIEEEKDDKIYVNKKENTLTVTVRDTVHKTEKSFPIDVKLDTVHVSSKNVTEYKYLIDEALATKTPIGGGLFELKEVVEVDGRKVTLTKIVDKNLDPVDTVQTVTYTVKQDGKNLTITYKIDNLSGQRVSDYEVSYQVDSCTTVSYYLNDDKKIAKNKEGNIAYTITYEYTDDFGNKASSKVDIIFDNIPPKVEIFDPEHGQSFNTNAIPVKWAVNGETQDTLTLQRLEKGVNYVIRRYVDKAGNVAADTVMVIMKEAKDIDIELVHPVTKVDQDKVDEYYSDHKYNDKKPFDVKFVDPKNDTIPEVVGVGFKVDIVLPSVSPTGSLATLDDIVKNGQIPVDDKGNIVGASTKGIPVDKYVEEHCTEEFQKDYQKNGLNIPLYDVTYNLHLWVYTNAANYVNDFTVEFTLNDEAKTTSAGTVQMVIDWLADKDGHVKAKNGHGLGTGAYLTKLFSKSVAKHRCDYKEQRKGDKTVKKDETFKTFGYKRPIAK